ncbi:MAG: outer-membrane lipoprotein carrier protein LolA [Alphaproteobacteria bacterium]|nr:outer-membrane lipoprotein carrier protein LolA [Alphaproteobacteria bacterium]
MRKLILTAALAFSFSTTAVSADFSPQDAADLDRLSDALNAIHSLKGEFVQQDPNGATEEGLVYIQKPGKMRFEYKPPSAVLIVSDGAKVAVFNRKLNTADRYPLWSTPLNLLLSDHVNFRRNTKILSIERQNGTLVVRARANSSRINGNITIVFSDPGLELKQWTVVDAQGLATTVILRNVETGVSLQPDLFLTHG